MSHGQRALLELGEERRGDGLDLHLGGVGMGVGVGDGLVLRFVDGWFLLNRSVEGQR